MYGLLQRPGIDKQWSDLLVDSIGNEMSKKGSGSGTGTGTYKIPTGVDAVCSCIWEEENVHPDLLVWLHFFDPARDDAGKAANLAGKAFEQANVTLPPIAVKKEKEVEKSANLDKPLPKLPTVLGFTLPKSLPTGLRSTDARRNQERDPEVEEAKVRMKIKRVASRIGEALTSAYR